MCQGWGTKEAEGGEGGGGEGEEGGRAERVVVVAVSSSHGGPSCHVAISGRVVDGSDLDCKDFLLGLLLITLTTVFSEASFFLNLFMPK